MKVCFYHRDFDRDVSSGTIHSAYQWAELLLAFGISEIAVINETEDEFPAVSSDLKVSVYKNFEEFMSANLGSSMMYIDSAGSTDYRDPEYKNHHWIVFDHPNPSPLVSAAIPLRGKRNLYSREAAAIVLAEVEWQSH